MILAIDTSCYTTSLCAVSCDTGKLLFENNRMLSVKPGMRGLRQSEGFFQHVMALPEQFEQCVAACDPGRIRAVAVTERPRPVAGSYMPVFQAGVQFGRTVAATLGCPLYTYSHQEGHLMAAACSSGFMAPSEPLDAISVPFYGFHFSGGTTEYLRVNRADEGFDITCVGGTRDLNFGQLIDRIGVELGLSFPCGQALDALAQGVAHEDAYAVRVTEDAEGTAVFNLSGMENKYRQMIGLREPGYIAKHLFNTLAGVVLRLVETVPPGMPILVSGGVASNSIIRKAFERRGHIYFAEPAYARDNAYGIALLGRSAYMKHREVDG